MMFKLYKLEFKSYLYSGASFQEGTIEFPGSDTIFSAVANTIAEIDGEEGLKEFVKTKPLFSSAFPYYKNNIFLPKPVGVETYFPKVLKKKLKKVRWVEKEIIEKGMWGEVEPKGHFISFDRIEKLYAEDEIVRNVKNRIRELTTIFTIRAFKFSNKAGLYFLYSGEYDISYALKILGEVGIGGGKSVGFGKFKVKSEEKFKWNSEREFGLLVSKCIPEKEEIHKLKNAQYSIGERGGWSENDRKKKLRVLIEGSVLPCDMVGKWIEEDIRNKNNKRKVYRNYRALILPLRWWSK